MTQMKVSTRLMLGFGIVLLIMAAIGVTGFLSIATLKAKIETVTGDRLPKVIWANNVIDQINLQGRVLRNSLIFDDHAEIKKELGRLPESRRILAENLKKLDDSIKSEKGRQLLAEVAKKREAYLTAIDAIIKELETGPKAGAAALGLLAKLRAVNNPYIEAVDKLIAFQTELATQDGKSAGEAAGTAQTLMIILMLAGLVAAVVTAWLITRKLVGQLGGEPDAAAAVARSIAQGDFTGSIDVRAGDQASMMASMKTMQDGLKTTVRDLRGAVGQVDAAAAAMADTAQQSAQGSADAAEAASAMAAAVEQVTVSINHVADSAKLALGIATRAGELSRDGGAVIDNTVTEMKHIADSVRGVADSIAALGEQSDRISGIVQTIKDVADQTNLLALNAAIEAARAGETGRGFAVVADEVRKLAERTTQATGEIGAMIGAIQGSAKTAVSAMHEAVSQVDRGTSLAGQAGEAITSIRSATREVTDVMNDISAAITEQGVASTSIAQQVERVAQASEENSASARQSSESAHELRSLATGMRSQMERFSV
ncbi:MAG: methyl-accepting chemotaxis protein [Rhodocyclaceae bacterium]|nr:methyl-accepting chemotaxis protein [Rhodocyclaceae bacterium]